MKKPCLSETLARHTGASRRQRVAMDVKTLVRRIGTAILGMVDEYWAMREPGQYGERVPQCEVRCEPNACVREDRSP